LIFPPKKLKAITFNPKKQKKKESSQNSPLFNFQSILHHYPISKQKPTEISRRFNSSKNSIIESTTEIFLPKIKFFGPW
jgi:hypothetical protein